MGRGDVRRSEEDDMAENFSVAELCAGGVLANTGDVTYPAGV
ncbi:hypothetical protein [Brevibacterium aurantiacum]|nr:hypothetical protein [Brevibacterium aurantiacum]